MEVLDDIFFHTTLRAFVPYELPDRRPSGMERGQPVLRRSMLMVEQHSRSTGGIPIENMFNFMSIRDVHPDHDRDLTEDTTCNLRCQIQAQPAALTSS